MAGSTSGSWKPLVDPECPAVQAHHAVSITDPLDLLTGLSYDEPTDWEVHHHRRCERCQRYGVEEPLQNVEEVHER